MFRRGIEAEILPYAREHNIGVLVYGPLAHGLLTGAIGRDGAFTADDWRSTNPIFAGADFELHLDVVEELKRFVGERGHTVSQLAVAWTLRHPAVQVAIVGSRHQRHIAESIGALELQLSDEELAEIDRILSAAGAVAIGGPTPEAMP
jgi:aryl-alcohol dehydrogenase-like predicted oxidoreductase